MLSRREGHPSFGSPCNPDDELLVVRPQAASAFCPLSVGTLTVLREAGTTVDAACVQALEKARTDAAEAGAAVKAAERQLAELERGVVKARMEAKSLRERAQDLADRLSELRAATKA